MATQSILETWVIDALCGRRATGRNPDLEARAGDIARRLERLGVRAVPHEHPHYPGGWRDLPDAPRVLFVRGEHRAGPGRSVAIVGARAASAYGAAVARRLALDLGGLGFTVISGLARGIDAAAHQGALASGGRTVAALPSGLDHITPTHHHELARAIEARGALMSERATGGPRFRGEFVRRNRLIAALAAATVVVEAEPGSGALTTAAAARDLGREVLAVPGDVDRAGTRGTHGLIRAGAALCEDAGDVLRAVETWTRRSRRPADGDDDGAGRDPSSRVLAALTDEPLGVEVLVARVAAPVSEVLASLLALRWAGMAEPYPGQRWARVRR